MYVCMTILRCAERMRSNKSRHLRTFCERRPKQGKDKKKKNKKEERVGGKIRLHDLMFYIGDFGETQLNMQFIECI